MPSSDQTTTVLALAAGLGFGAAVAMYVSRPSAPPSPRSSSSAAPDAAGAAPPAGAHGGHHGGHRGTGSMNNNQGETCDTAIRRGFSMKDALQHNAASCQHASTRTPEEVMDALQRGNTRFWMGAATRPTVSAFQRRAHIFAQHPSVAVLGCADSRVPIEIIFDQGLGDVFTIRVAGNCLDTSTEGSLEYAVVHLKVKVLVIMGHEGCGAVGAARLPVDKLDQEPKALGDLLKSIKTGLDETRLQHVHDKCACDREAVVTNVKAQVAALMRNAAVKAQVEKGALLVKGAFYEQSSGMVDFL